MANVFSTSRNIDIRFDLKGSKIGRQVIKDDNENTQMFLNGDMALKDLDFEKFGEKIHIGKKNTKSRMRMIPTNNLLFGIFI